ncbi:hypothetical protein ScPMuIL_017006 [Solemya velum]
MIDLILFMSALYHTSQGAGCDCTGFAVPQEVSSTDSKDVTHYNCGHTLALLRRHARSICGVRELVNCSEIRQFTPQVITCSSMNFAEVVCVPDFSGDETQIREVDLVQQLSTTLCVRDETYEVFKDKIVVKNGCRGVFKVQFQESN